MKRREVVISHDAQQDLIQLYDWIAAAGGSQVALSYVERLENYCKSFDLAAERGVLREDIRPGLRVVGFEHRVTIAFLVEDTRVVILRLFYGGRNWNDLLQ